MLVDGDAIKLFWRYWIQRADMIESLALLSSKTLLCDCDGQHCPAAVLQELSLSIFAGREHAAITVIPDSAPSKDTRIVSSDPKFPVPTPYTSSGTTFEKQYSLYPQRF